MSGLRPWWGILPAILVAACAPSAPASVAALAGVEVRADDPDCACGGGTLVAGCTVRLELRADRSDGIGGAPVAVTVEVGTYRETLAGAFDADGVATIPWVVPSPRVVELAGTPPRRSGRLWVRLPSGAVGAWAVEYAWVPEGRPEPWILCAWWAGEDDAERYPTVRFTRAVPVTYAVGFVIRELDRFDPDDLLRPLGPPAHWSEDRRSAWERFVPSGGNDPPPEDDCRYAWSVTLAVLVPDPGGATTTWASYDAVERIWYRGCAGVPVSASSG